MAKGKTPNEDQPNDSENFNESDDTFGLPEIEYEPIDRDKSESTETTQEESTTYESQSSYQEETQEPTPMEEDNYSQQSYSYSYQEEPSPVWPKALLIVVLILVVLGGGLWYFLYYKPQKDEEERLLAEKARREEVARRAEQARADSIRRVENERQQRIADSLALANTRPAEGSIEQLGGRTGTYYVIAASNIDDDLLMDYARKLSSQGVSSKIIPPFGKVNFYRLAIEEGGTYQETQAKADNLKGEFGDKLWVLKY